MHLDYDVHYDACLDVTTLKKQDGVEIALDSWLAWILLILALYVSKSLLFHCVSVKWSVSSRWQV